MNTIDITPIFEAIITIIVLVVAKFLVPWIKSKTTAEAQSVLYDLVSIAVTAAEQLYTGSGRGAEKKEWVMNWLNKRGLSIDEETVDAIIESCVYEINSSAGSTDKAS